jgi:hypothetical protein
MLAGGGSVDKITEICVILSDALRIPDKNLADQRREFNGYGQFLPPGRTAESIYSRYSRRSVDQLLASIRKVVILIEGMPHGAVSLEECPSCRDRNIYEERVKSENKQAIAEKEQNREMRRKWDKYIKDLPPYKRFRFEVIRDDGAGTSMSATADTETEEEARKKLKKYIEDTGGGISLGTLLHSEDRGKSFMRRNLLEDKYHLEQAGIPEDKVPSILGDLGW